MSNYYESGSINSIERVVLAETIKLPSVSTYPLTHRNLKENGEYKLAIHEYKDIKAKFYLPIMTPLLNKDTNQSSKSAPNLRNNKGSKLNVEGYTTSNYIELVIPKYILLEFIDSIPAGTEFIMGSIGGTTEIEDMRIIGIYTTYES